MKDLNTNLLRSNQREQLRNEIDQSERMLKTAKPDDAAIIQAGIKRSKKQLDTQSPEPLTGKEKDTLHALEKKLLNRITTNMPTDEVMRKNPPGAVDWHTRWEKANKKLIRVWKNIRIQLNPDNKDKDLANIERFRPSGVANRLRADAQIPGLMSYSDIPDEQWPFDAPQNTALEQAKRNSMTEDEAIDTVNKALEEYDAEAERDAIEEEEREDNRKKPISAEQHAVLIQRLANAREAKRKKEAEERQVEETLNAVPEPKAL